MANLEFVADTRKYGPSGPIRKYEKAHLKQAPLNCAVSILSKCCNRKISIAMLAFKKLLPMNFNEIPSIGEPL